MKRSFINILLTTILAVVAISCKAPETIVVKSSPEVAAKNTTFTVQDTTNQKVMVLKYGELDPIESLDPLFALNPASQRLILLIYEGLVSYNENGQIVPAIAKSWNVNPDSLTYTFHLRTNDFYQDNECFTSGLGRQVDANDIKDAFQRMCLNTVPPNAAHLFMAIDGFDTYFKEQHQIFNKRFRTLKGVPGIIVKNDSTVQFDLAIKDPHFLQKLASPLAVIYPPEALNFQGKGLNQNPVGSGPFAFNNSESDTLFVLKKNKNYWKKSADGHKLPLLNEIDVSNIKNEATLYRALVSGKIQYVPELGPQIIHQVVDQKGNLKKYFEKFFSLYQTGGINQYRLHYNPGNRYGISVNEAAYLTNMFPFNKYAEWLGTNTIKLTYLVKTPKSINAQALLERLGKNQKGNYYSASFSNDVQGYNFISTYLDTLSKKIKVQIFKSPVIGRNMVIYINRDPKYYPGQNNYSDSDVLLKFGIKRYAITGKNVQNIELNKFSWWQNLSHAKTPPVTS